MRALALLGAALIVGLAAAGCGGGEEEADASELPLGRKVSAQATLDPTVHVFAEPVLARLEVVVDNEEIDPDRVSVETKFLPYDVKATSGSRTTRGRFTTITYEYVLRCLRIACIPDVLQSAAGEAESGRGERRAFNLPSADVLVEDADGGTKVVRSVRWPELVSVSRLKESDVSEFDEFVFKTSVAPLPEPDYRISPTLLGFGLLAAALALLALPATLVVRWLRGRRPAAPIVELEPEPTPLARALRLVEWARGRENGSERREALEVLAVELDVVALPELAGSARALAWSAASPSPEAAGTLVEEVRDSDAADT
jgi:hypothetical protein